MIWNKNNIRSINQLIFIAVMLFVASASFSGCMFPKYSMSGVNLPPTVQSVSIKYFPNRAPLIMPTLSQSFTEALKDKFLNQTSLVLKKEGETGDLHFEGEISGYSTEPLGIQGNDIAAQNRLKVTVRVKFMNGKDSKFDFDETFTRYADYASTRSLADAEGELLEVIIEQLIEDIFNKSVVNW